MSEPFCLTALTQSVGLGGGDGRSGAGSEELAVARGRLGPGLPAGTHARRAGLTRAEGGRDAGQPDVHGRAAARHHL